MWTRGEEVLKEPPRVDFVFSHGRGLRNRWRAGRTDGNKDGQDEGEQQHNGTEAHRALHAPSLGGGALRWRPRVGFSNDG